VSDAELRDLLQDVADQARFYDVADAALSGARRRRRARLSVAPALVAAAVAGVVAIHPPRTAPETSNFTPPVELALTALPAKVQPLPPGDVGPGIMLARGCYGANSDCDVRILLADGKQFRLPDANKAPTIFDEPLTIPSLSPSGRRLIYLTAPKAAAVRDLETGAEQPVTGVDVGGYRPSRAVWSADENVVAVGGQTSADGPPRVVTVDARSGAAAKTTVGGWADVVAGVTPSGEPVLLRGSAVRLTVVREGQRPLPLDNGTLLGRHEHFGGATGMFSALSPDGDTLAIAVFSGTRTTALLLFDLRTGRAKKRLNQPDRTVSLRPCAFRHGGIVALRTSAETDPSPVGGLLLIDPDTGRSASILRLNTRYTAPRC
jgi:hypothetical protein